MAMNSPSCVQGDGLVGNLIGTVAASVVQGQSSRVVETDLGERAG
jgi:hypothetical protein